MRTLLRCLVLCAAVTVLADPALGATGATIVSVSTGERLASASGSFADLRWEPDGRRVLAISRAVGGESALVAIAPGRPVELIERLDPLLGLTNISPDGSVLAGRALDERPDIVSAVIVERGGRVRARGFAVTPPDIGSLSWSPDGRLLAVIGTGSHPLEGGVVVADAATGRQLRAVRRGRGALAPTSWSPDGRFLAYTPFPVRRRTGGRSRTERYGVNVLDVTTGRVRALAGRTRGRWFFSPAFSPDGRTIAVGDRRDLTLVRRASGRTQRLRRLSHRPTQLTWSPDGRTIAFTRTGRDLVVLDRASRTLRTVGRLRSGEALVHLTWSPDGTRLAAAYMDTGAP